MRSLLCRLLAMSSLMLVGVVSSTGSLGCDRDSGEASSDGKKGPVEASESDESSASAATSSDIHAEASAVEDGTDRGAEEGTRDVASRSIDTSVGIEEDFGFSRRRSISDLADIVEPPEDPPTTMALGTRSREGERTVTDGIRVRTECGETFCVDGLIADGRTMLEAIPTQKPGGNGRLERVVRVTWVTDHYVSAYIATSRYSGGANAHNDLRCRTFDRETGEIVPLDAIFVESAADRLLEKAKQLLEPDRAIKVIGRRVEGAGMQFEEAGFRLARTSNYRGIHPEVIVCGNGQSAGSEGSILEMQVEEFPVGYLLRPPER